MNSLTNIHSKSLSFLHNEPVVFKNEEFFFKDLCFKIFIIFSTVLAAVVIIVGILALMACKGLVPVLTGITQLSVIGTANSYVMICSGIALFVLGVLSWGFHLKNEKNKSALRYS